MSFCRCSPEVGGNGPAGRASVRMILALGFAAEGLDQVEGAAPDRRIADTIISANQFESFPLRHGFELIGLGRHLHDPGPLGSRLTSGHILEEETDGNVQHLGKVVEATCANTVRTPFVLLKLLKGDTDSFTKFFLAQSEQCAAQPKSGTYMYVNRVWSFTSPRYRIRSYR